jgi:hypothetical protein
VGVAGTSAIGAALSRLMSLFGGRAQVRATDRTADGRGAPGTGEAMASGGWPGRCPSCHAAIVEEDSRFCPKCGARLGGG